MGECENTRQNQGWIDIHLTISITSTLYLVTLVVNLIENLNSQGCIIKMSII